MQHLLLKVCCLAWPLCFPFVICLCAGSPVVTDRPIYKRGKVTLFQRQEMTQPTLTTRLQTDVVTLYGFDLHLSVHPIGTAAIGDETTYVVQRPGIICGFFLEDINESYTDGC
jgi:hypothetical protein